MRIFMIAVLLVAISAVTASAQDLFITKDNCVVCVLKSDVEKLTSYASVGDSTAFQSMVDGVRCTILKPGVEVQRMDVTLGGLVEIRPMGTTVTVWTVRDNIQQK